MNNKEQEKSLHKAKIIGLRLLKFRLQSEQELHDKLKAKNLPIPVIEQTIQHFNDLGFVNDQQFARQWTSSRLKRPFGLNRIRMELKKKGINAAIIQETLDEAAQNYEELAVVTALIQHRASKYQDIAPDKIKQRLYGYLQRRGFNTNIIIKAINIL